MDNKIIDIGIFGYKKIFINRQLMSVSLTESKTNAFVGFPGS